MAHLQNKTITGTLVGTALVWLAASVVSGCDSSGSDVTWDDDSAGDDDATADDDDATSDDDDSGATGDDDDTGDAQDCSGGSGAAVGGEFFTADGASTWLYVPAGVLPCAPLLLLGHGGSSPGGTLPDGSGMWYDQLGTDLPARADQLGFALMVPYLEDAQQVQHQWNTAEIPQLDAMIAEAASRLDIDRNRVLFAGQSAGGHMAAYYGLYEPGNAPQIAVVSAGLGGYFDYPTAEPDPKLPFFVAHDPDDQIVPYSYSENLAAELDAHGHEFVFQDYVMTGSNHHGWSQDVTTDLLEWWL
jgi:predicted esterase